MRIFPFGKWLFEASPGGWMQVLGCSASKSTDVTDTIKSEAHSEACKDPAGNMLSLQWTDQQRVHLGNIPGQTLRPPKALWMKDLVWGVFQHWFVVIGKKRKKKKQKGARWRVTGRIFHVFPCEFPPLSTRTLHWPIPFPHEILMSGASEQIFACECPIRLALIRKIHCCNMKMVQVRGRLWGWQVRNRRQAVVSGLSDSLMCSLTTASPALKWGSCGWKRKTVF